MPFNLPPHPNLDFLKKQAKQILQQFRKHDRSILPFLKHLKKVDTDSEDDLFESNLSLQDVQHCLSREYGFNNWNELSDFVLTDVDVREKCFKELRSFLGHDNRFKAWPAKRKKQLFLIEFLSTKFKPNHFYTEPEVNRILTEHHSFNDPAILRRALVAYGYLDREKDCSRYWKKTINH